MGLGLMVGDRGIHLEPTGLFYTLDTGEDGLMAVRKSQVISEYFCAHKYGTT
jgi:hypothetical protein